MLDDYKTAVETLLNTTKLDADNIQSGAITETLIANAAVTASKIGSSAVTTSKILDANVTRAKLVAVGQQLSSSCGASMTITGTSYTDVTNLTVTLTTTGRPVRLFLVCADTTNTSKCYINRSNGGTSVTGFIKFIQDSSDIAIVSDSSMFSASSSSIVYGIPIGAISHTYSVAAGTYVYKIQAKTGGATETINFEYLRLMAYEL